MEEAEEIAEAFGIQDINLVKPGIGEATRVLLRRVPWRVLVHSLDDQAHLGHLYQLAAENANVKNLITGTRYLNMEGMLPFENMVADYVEETGNHVAYRVTPVFHSDDLLASGVLMEGYSIEDQGEGICFCIFAYNVQPGVTIDYRTGESRLSEDREPGDVNTVDVPLAATPAPAISMPPTATLSPAIVEPPSAGPTQPEQEEDAPALTVTYIVNTNTGKFHYPSCSSVGQMNEENKWRFSGTADELLQKGYVPCQRCRP